MAEHLRAFVVVFVLAIVTFAITRKALAEAIDSRTFKEWRNTWLTLTVVAFLSHSFWLYAAVAALLLVVGARRTDNPAALFFACLFAVPAAGIQIPGFGMVNYLIGINHLRILEIFLLLPAYLLLKSRGSALRFGAVWPDRLISLLALLMVVLQLRGTTVTDTLRQGVYVLIDVLLPYYVISRSIRDISALKVAVAAFIVAATLLAGLAAFETVRHWNLYSAMITALDPSMNFGAYLGRAGVLRASASAGHSIALGFVLAVAIGFYLFFQSEIRSKLLRRIGWAGLLVGLIAPFSRGPWVGAAVILATYIATGRAAARKLVALMLAGILSLPLLSVLPGGEKILGLLPFVGTVEKGNIEYRERLIENAWIVIQRNPLLGSVDYRSTPEMESMRQGQGIIDIVNTYIGIALEYGFVGLALFVGFFLTVLYGVFKAMRALKHVDEDMNRLGRALFATLTGILVIIFTVSSITVIPIVYWSVAALCVAYVQIARSRLKQLQAGEQPAVA